MKIRIVYYDEKLSWDKKWIFLGSSFKKLRIAEKNIAGSRIKINDFLHNKFDEELKNYLDWTDKQRIFFNDSPDWWMTELAGRNNLSSDFFLYICQIKSLQKILKSYEEKEFLIVSDDVLLIQAIIENLKNFVIIKSNFVKFKIFKNLFEHYLKFIKSILVSVIDIIVFKISAKITLKNKNKPKGDIYLVHQYAEVESLRNNRKLQTRYFPYLKEYFLKEKIDLYFLTWSYTFLYGKIKALKKLRMENSFIPEDWLNLTDYISAIKNFLRVKLCFSQNHNYPELDIKKLILREKRKYLEQMSYNLRFWTYLPAIKKWSTNCTSLTCIDHYENMNFEHALIAATKKLNIKTNTIGYHHTLSSKEFTAWHNLYAEWSSKFKPDYVISLGSISSKILKDQGVPVERIIEGPALRYNKILNREKKTNKKKDCIIIPLSHIRDASLELVTNVKKLAKEMENTHYKFVIKPHPNLNIFKVLSKSELNEMPKNISFSEEDLDNLLNNYLLTIFMSTGAAYNAVINGNIVINLRSELNFSDNYLDIFNKDFKYVESYTVDEVKNLLFQFIKNDRKINEYEIEFDRLRKYLINGMNLVNDSSLSKFRLS